MLLPVLIRIKVHDFTLQTYLPSGMCEHLAREEPHMPCLQAQVWIKEERVGIG